MTISDLNGLIPAWLAKTVCVAHKGAGPGSQFRKTAHVDLSNPSPLQYHHSISKTSRPLNSWFDFSPSSWGPCPGILQEKSYSSKDMCGIAGIVGASSTMAQLERMAESQAHRGPDHTGFLLDNEVAFTHQRLSIVDLDARSNQPMTKGPLTIVFNGEIYNFREIRKQLSGYATFDTTSDTEVVIEAWRKWGPECLPHFRGMYAFAIFDSKTKETFIARDPFGIKPLFYTPIPDGGLAFASELKTLEAYSADRFTLNSEAVNASMMYVWIPENLCIWKEVHKLAPGHFLHVRPNGAFSSIRYSQPLEHIQEEPNLVDEDLTVDALERCLKNSVDAHLVADVPINSFLSGGLDSSLIVAMAKQELDELDCYTIKFTDDARKHEAMTDDAFYASKVATALNVNLNVIEVQPDIMALLPKIVHHLDEPIGDSAAINTFLICDAARKNGVKVLLSGMGADELFGGYRKHFANQLAARYRILPSPLRRSIISPLVKRIPVASNSRGLRLARWGRRFVEFADLPEPDAFLRSYSYFNPEELIELAGPESRTSVEKIVEYHHSIFNSLPSRSLLDRMCYTDTQMFMTSLNLAYTDRASMAASTEVRVPFIDKEVARIAFQISSKLKIKGRTSKYILKKVAERWLPKDIIYRPKASFTMPLRAWMKTDLREAIDDYVLSSQGLAGRGLFDGDILRDIVEADRSGRADNAQRIWQFLTLEQWLRSKGQ
jgi:asparagine synthase (glutamine-hydrolysing)